MARRRKDVNDSFFKKHPNLSLIISIATLWIVLLKEFLGRRI